MYTSQLYVRSWLDTNGDGCGDLRGVTAGLDYLSWLGVDGIWLSPTMPSPDHDWGYDVCDYFGVHPALGTLGDLDVLIGDTWVGDVSRMAAYHGRGDELQLTMNFPFIFAEFTAPALTGGCRIASRRDKALGERDGDLADAPGAGDEETAIPTVDRVCEGSKRGGDVSSGPFGTKGSLIRNGPGFTASLRFSCRLPGKHYGLYRWARLAPERAHINKQRNRSRWTPTWRAR